MSAQKREKERATVIKGKVYVVGDNIDTDQIIPAKFLNLVPTIPGEYRALGSHAFSGLPEGCQRFIAEGANASEFAIVVAGRNFGCGSSREHAPIALGAAGVRAVAAESYARIFFRNAISTGELYPFESEERVVDAFKTGEEAELDVESGRLTNKSTGAVFSLKSLGAVAPVVEAGGLFEYARSVGMIRTGKQRGRVGPRRDDGAEVSGAPPRATRAVAVVNQKGGVGKTTTSVNLAAALAELGQKVLVVDLDPQANATSGLAVHVEPGSSLYGALIGDRALADLVAQTGIPNLDIVASELDLAGAEVELARSDEYVNRFARTLAPVKAAGTYDFIVVDCPPSLGILTTNALAAVDSALIPIQCEYYALEGLGTMAHLLERIRENGTNPGIEIEGVLMTMFDPRTNLAAEVVREVRSHFGDLVYETIIPRNVRLSEAPSHGKPVIHYASESSGAKAYRALGMEFLARARRKAADG